MASKRKRSADDIIAEVFKGERGKRAPKRKPARKRQLPRSDGRLEYALIGATLEAHTITLQAISAELNTHKELMSKIHNVLQEHDQRIHAFEATEASDGEQEKAKDDGAAT